MTSGLGLVFEFLFSSLILGWGFFELRGLRRDKKRAEEKARAAEADDEARE